jgi:hypothetical protein
MVGVFLFLEIAIIGPICTCLEMNSEEPILNVFNREKKLVKTGNLYLRNSKKIFQRLHRRS